MPSIGNGGGVALNGPTIATTATRVALTTTPIGASVGTTIDVTTTGSDAYSTLSMTTLSS